ncbi:MAG: superoxide dismutase [Candidatus Kerfeldbacteria bacterium]|nr:superoxide dismutase [Candidatus Kerfeldbacteria bacterium]
MKHALPPLPYAYNALEPYIDARTMEIHHTKHHQTYVDKLNAVLEKHPDIAERPVEDLLQNLEQLNLPEPDKKAVRNHGGGHVNHSLFWKIMGSSKEVNQELVHDVDHAYGSLVEFKKQFTDLATTLFGSGWVWLAKDEAGKLHLHQLPNQDSPYLHGHTPIIGLDVWEHAYYLKYQNKRPDYIQAWWSVLKLLP